jgi:peptidoglycan/LPS O-acetylase OafA/YrhL
MQLPALTGIRFFAIFHIYLFHLWVLFDSEKPKEFSNLLIGIADLPKVLQNVMANGWMSTSFFFILSGFILTYVYRRPDGDLVMPAKRFLFLRLTRLYPIHLITLLLTFLIMTGFYLGNGRPVADLAISAIANLTLVQSWYPPFVPVWSWPTWTISVLLFLYVMMPFLLRCLNSLTQKQMQLALVILPLVSLLPTLIYSFYFPLGSEPVQNWQIFIGSFPPFWLAQFFAGMVLCRFVELSRFNPRPETEAPAFAWGDCAVLVVLGLACIPNIEEPIKYFLRHGLMMPLYMIIIVDFARSRGFFARLLANKWMSFLGETGYSMFIWQNLIMVFCWGTIMANPSWGRPQFYVAVGAMIAVALISTYWIEKPIARKLRKKFLGS